MCLGLTNNWGFPSFQLLNNYWIFNAFQTFSTLFHTKDPVKVGILAGVSVDGSTLDLMITSQGRQVGVDEDLRFVGPLAFNEIVGEVIKQFSRHPVVACKYSDGGFTHVTQGGGSELFYSPDSPDPGQRRETIVSR